MIFSRVGLMLLYSVILCTGIHCVPCHLLCLPLSSNMGAWECELAHFFIYSAHSCICFDINFYFAYQFCLIGWHEKKTQLELGVVKIPSK